jgi:GTP-binding protein Era
MPEATPRSGSCAIVGRSNVGKSTLLNALLGQKLAIATPRPQTTRDCILGVFVDDSPPTQIAFLDTPGLHRPHNALGRALLENAKGGLVDAEIVVLVTDTGPRPDIDSLLGTEERRLLESLRAAADERPALLVINKVDLVRDKRLLLPLIEQCAAAHPFAAVIPLSALKRDNLEALVAGIRSHLPEGLRYDTALFTDRPERFFVAELIREAAIVNTRQELPYSIAVKIERYQEQPRITRVAALVIVEKEAHKGIVIGKGGRRLKRIGSEARSQIESLLGRKVFLELWVKVIEGWTEKPAAVHELQSEIAGTNGY